MEDSGGECNNLIDFCLVDQLNLDTESPLRPDGAVESMHRMQLAVTEQRPESEYEHSVFSMPTEKQATSFHNQA